MAVDDGTQAQVDVGTGNLLVTSHQLTLPGVTADVPVGLTFNSLSLGTAGTSATNPVGQGWRLAPVQTTLTAGADGSVTYTAGDGRTGLFVLEPGSTSQYDAPASFKADLVKTGSTGWTLTDHVTRTVQTFNASGILTSVTDRDGNQTTSTWAGSGAGSRLTGITQASSPSRSVGLTVTSGSTFRLTKLTNTVGDDVSFGYTGDDLTSISNGAGDEVRFVFDAEHRVTQVTQVVPGGSGDAVTRLVYQSEAVTLMADPTTNSTLPVASVPHTRYELTSDGSGPGRRGHRPNGGKGAALVGLALFLLLVLTVSTVVAVRRGSTRA